MKRVDNLFEKIISKENLLEAFNKAAKGKNHYEDVQKVQKNLDKCINSIQDILVKGYYKVSPYITKKIMENGKERVINKLPFYPDRIIQWAIMLQLEPMFHSNFCSHVCASIPERGIDYARKLTSKYLKNKEATKYCLKIDVRKFYDTIKHDILKKLLISKIKDMRVLDLIFKIIDSYNLPQRNILEKMKNAKTGLEYHNLRISLYSSMPKGLPIGSYLSQYLANFYLSKFDHWLKEELRLRYVVRYMDDVVILHSSKQELHNIRLKIIDYLYSKLRLVLKKNHQVFPVDVRGIDFVGYRFFRKFTLLRKRNVIKLKRLYNKVITYRKKRKVISHHLFCSIFSYLGMLRRCNGYRLFIKYFYSIRKELVKFYVKYLNYDILKERHFNKNFIYNYVK